MALHRVIIDRITLTIVIQYRSARPEVQTSKLCIPEPLAAEL